MEIFLFVISGISMCYYVLLVVFTDVFWVTQLYWPVSAAVFTLTGLLLWVDRKRKQEMPSAGSKNSNFKHLRTLFSAGEHGFCHDSFPGIFCRFRGC